MITSIRIGKKFSTYENEHWELRATQTHRYFLLSQLPEGHVLDTSSNLVLIIGDNGTGKTTLLKRISEQRIDVTYNYGTSYVVGHNYNSQIMQPRLPFLSTEPLTKEQTMSQGTYKLHLLGERLEEEYQRAQKNLQETHVVLLDQPEDSISLRNKRRLADILSQSAFEKGLQLFVATHEPCFLQIPGSRIINLDEKPAGSYAALEFDLENI